MRAAICLRRAALCLAPLCSILSTTLALAAPVVAGDTPGPKPAKNDPPEVAPSEGPVQWLPSTAYPEWTDRGIPGGSLRLSASMHGMQWPYYPTTGIGISGGTWVDTGYETITSTNSNFPRLKYFLNQGRAWLRVTPTYTADGWFAQTQIELVGNKDQSRAQPFVADVDDLWVRAGQWKKWDIQVGRFEALEVYHFGLALDLNTLERQGATDASGLNNVVYRQSGVGNFAFHAYPGDHLRLEALGQFGYDTLGLLSTVGGRAAAVLDYGWIKLKAAADVRSQFPVAASSKEDRVSRGGQGALQFVVAPYVEFGGNVSYGLVDHHNQQNTVDPTATQGDFDPLGSVTTWSAGGFANGRIIENLVLGGGINMVTETDQSAGEFKVRQVFGALQYVLGGRIYIKAVVASANANMGKGGSEPYDNNMISGRLRLMYLY
jgi:hypothetical protein